VTPPLGARAPALTASTLTPLSVWPCGPPWRVGKHKGAQTAIGPSRSPSRSLETARPVGRVSALDLCPGAKVSGSHTPWYDGWAEIITFRYLPVLLGGKGTSHVSLDTGDLPSQGKNYGHRTPPGPCVPHGGTPEAPDRRRRVVAPGGMPQYPLTPSGWHALRPGVWHRRSEREQSFTRNFHNGGSRASPYCLSFSSFYD
jgi:hypothetical protein